MKRGDGDLIKVQEAIKGARFLSSTVLTIDIDTLERALDGRYEEGYRDGKASR